jgi:large subunit ribosomal protein L29
MKIGDITGQSDEQLALALKDTEKTLFQLRFQSATDRLETPSEIRKAKRDIARIKMVQRQRQLKKLADLPDADLQKQLADIQTKTEGPGKRRAKRAQVRVEAILAARTTKKGSGK